jgi:hypothetical protein
LCLHRAGLSGGLISSQFSRLPHPRFIPRNLESSGFLRRCGPGLLSSHYPSRRWNPGGRPSREDLKSYMRQIGLFMTSDSLSSLPRNVLFPLLGTCSEKRFPK